MSVAHYVLPGRCGDCGHLVAPRWNRSFKTTVCDTCRQPLTAWTPAKIVEAAQAWAEEHGRPPLSTEWRRGTVATPDLNTVARYFGTWNRMLAAAHLARRRRKSNPVWSKDAIADLMLDWRFSTGRWPTFSDWNNPLRVVDGERTIPVARDRARPHANTVLRIFGSWNAAKRHAGWNGERQTQRRPLKEAA